MKILLVEDDRRIVTALQEALTDQGYVLEIAEDGKTGLAFAEGASFDLIILDWMLPHLDGISLCKKLRQRGDRTPILILTARDTSSDKVVGLDVGADDYVVKPFDLPELLARVRALLRRGVVTFSPVLEWERLTFDPGECRAEYNQQPISLTPKEYGLLELLLRNGSRVLDLQEMARSAADLWELIHHEYAELGEEDDRPPVPLNPDGTPQPITLSALLADAEDCSEDWSGVPEPSLETIHTGIEWYDAQQRLMVRDGNLFPADPLPAAIALDGTLSQVEQIRSLTFPIDQARSEESLHLVGYVRTSESTTDLEAELLRLRWGLGLGGLLVAGLTALGGICLTQESLKPIIQNFDQLRQFTSDKSMA